MPTDAGPEGAAKRLADGQGLRMALGVWTPFVLGMGFNWPFAFLGAVFAALFLQAPSPPSPKAGAMLIATAFALLLMGFVVFSVLLPYPASFLLAQALMIGWGFSLSVSGKSPLLVVLALMDALMMPYMARLSLDVAWTLALWLPINMGIALLSCWAVFALFPPAAMSAEQEAAVEAPPPFDPERRLLRMMLVTLPFVALFILFDSGAILTLIFVAILAQQLAASTGAGPAVAKGMLLANIAGGLVAILCYELVVSATNFGFMAVIAGLLCLGFARWFTSAHVSAALAGSALTTALILFGGAMAPFGGDVEGKMLSRLVQVGAALVWVLTAFVAVDYFLPEREKRPGDPSGGPKRRVRPGRVRIARSEAPPG
ncbi:DUF2955 domain-containing protein [Aliiruegeria sabulilitoris]|uniref:DUF2955 domain-containing protein n=1 Tax=Aliiruegeria sabulilitoris TaxID=1510458 RepID=UPI0009E8646D|nr:DUF2955 domain-containing protein [Aliiruegeria sabulilitoris]NDR55806.1 DUF2955 domain-containing protein [Pseudoruegeria sp. M32A2M]